MYAFTYLRQLLPLPSRQKSGNGPENMEQGAAVKNLLGRQGMQAKQPVGEPSDRYEKEADLIARYVTQGLDDKEIDVREAGEERPQRLCTNCEEQLQAKTDDGVGGMSVDSAAIKKGWVPVRGFPARCASISNLASSVISARCESTEGRVQRRQQIG